MVAETSGPAMPAAEVTVGQTVDGWRIEEPLHRGGMATLWRVVRLANAGPVAGWPAAEPLPAALVMKVPRIRSGEDPAAVVGFEVEQMILPRLAGAHVPRFVAAGGFAQQPYIVMERIPGASLKARFDVAPLPLDEVVEVGWRVATALHDLHRQRVVHLDVKPSNIVFRPGRDGHRGAAVLVDYGLSRHADLPDLLEADFPLPLGTSPYLSPEQLRNVRSDPRSDLFALGVVLYALATGVRPFGAPETVRGLQRRLVWEPLPPRAVRPEIPPWLQEVILRCVEVDPDARHQSGAQLAFDLRHPEQVALTPRSARLKRGSTLHALKRWAGTLRAPAQKPAAAASRAGAIAGRAPIVLVALDLAGSEPALLDAVRRAVLRLLATDTAARVACLAVIKTGLLGNDEPGDGDGASLQVRLRVQLEHWAHPVLDALGLRASAAAGRVSYHVAEAGDVADAIVDYAHRNHVDHIVLGARSKGRWLRTLGSVSAAVAANADCDVTVVRVPGGARVDRDAAS